VSAQKMFRVTARKFYPPKGFNPFAVKDLFSGPKIPMERRTWEFKASSEKEVRKFWAEAQRDRLSNVYGFTLDSIEQIESPPPSAPGKEEK
jgi:hypothetical protein